MDSESESEPEVTRVPTDARVTAGLVVAVVASLKSEAMTDAPVTA